MSIKRQKDTFAVKLPNDDRHELDVKTAIGKLKQPNISECLDCILATLSTKLPAVPEIKKTDVYRLVLHEFSELCNIYMNLDGCAISPDLSEITLIVCDLCNRKHELVVGVDYSKTDSEIFYLKRQDLPRNSLVKSGASLKVICEKFLNLVRAFQSFWNVTDDFDGNFWIMEPENPKRGDVHRRLSLGG